MAVQTQTRMIEDLGNGVPFRRTKINAPAVHAVEVYTDATRPSATLYDAGEAIWNTDDQAWNYSDGLGATAAWRNALGVLT